MTDRPMAFHRQLRWYWRLLCNTLLLMRDIPSWWFRPSMWRYALDQAWWITLDELVP